MSDGLPIAEVQQTLRDAWPEAPICPNDVACYRLATLVQVIKAVTVKRRRHKPKQRDELSASGRKFLRELETSLKRTKSQLPAGIPPEIVSSTLDNHPDIREMEEARHAVQAVLQRRKSYRPEPCQRLAEAVIETWKHVDVEISRDPKPDHALCRAVTALLTICGIHYSPETVSDALRGRSARPRSSGRKTVEKALAKGHKIPQKLPS